MSKLLIAGCSNAAGFEIYAGEQQDSTQNRHASFGNLLAQHMDREPVNIAIGGATNSSIARSIMAYVAEHSIQDLHVLCAWTDADRLDAPWTWQVNLITFHYYTGCQIVMMISMVDKIKCFTSLYLELFITISGEVQSLQRLLEGILEVIIMNLT